MILNSPYISGSITVTGNSIVSGSITVLGGLSGSNAVSASYAVSASNAATASSADNLLVRNTLTAQTIVVQTITSSIDWVTGSAKFGSVNTDAHTFTGSVSISGSSIFGLNVNAGALYVSSSGRVGIGTTNPTAALQVSGSTIISNNQNSLTRLIITNTTTGTNSYVETTLTSDSSAGSGAVGKFSSTTTPYKITTASNTFLYNGSTAGDIAILNDFASGNIKFATGGSSTSQMFISASGFVGIGTTTPLSPLHVVRDVDYTGPTSTGNAQGHFIVGRTNNSGLSIGSRRGTGTSGYTWFQAQILDATQYNNDIVLQPNGGNVGIGVTSTVGKLDIATGGNTNVVISNDSTDTGYNIVSLNGTRTKGSYAGIAGGGTGDNRLYLNSGDAVVIQTGGSYTERMRITSNGATIMYNNMAVVDGQEIYDTQTYAANTGGTINFGGKYNSAGTYTLYARVSGRKENSTDGNTAGYLLFTTKENGGGATERMRITSDGYLRLVSKGIQFNNDTADANSLDDYEEGSFTPVVIGSSSAGTANYSANQGRYVKIGRAVNFNFYLDWNGGNGTGNLYISGLPFTADSAAIYPACAIGEIQGIALTANNIATARVQISTTSIYINQSPVGGGAVTSVPYDGTGYIVLSGTYYV